MVRFGPWSILSSNAGIVLLAFLSGCPNKSADSTFASPCDELGVICTVAGTGRSLFDGDGRPALRTSLYFPLDVDFDSAGRPLILDWNNIRIRRINPDTSIQTIMGLDYEDFPVNGTLARETPLHHASDIAFDLMGRMYVAGNHAPVVIRIDLDNRVLVIAGNEAFGNDGDGGWATDARLTSPFGVLPLADGSFYFTDIDAHVVRLVDAEGMITTVAGNGTPAYSGDGEMGAEARINGPTRLARDGQGNVYFCDTNNHVIRRLATDGVISTFAGTGEIGYSGDDGPANAARLSSPYDVRFAANGDCYLADTGNNVIRRIDKNGRITTVVGTGAAGFEGDEGAATECRLDGPSAVYFDAHGNMWIADTFNQRVRRVAGYLSFQERGD